MKLGLTEYTLIIRFLRRFVRAEADRGELFMHRGIINEWNRVNKEMVHLKSSDTWWSICGRASDGMIIGDTSTVTCPECAEDRGIIDEIG